MQKKERTYERSLDKMKGQGIFFLFFAACLPFCIESKTLQDIKDSLKKYEEFDWSEEKKFFKVLSWMYNEDEIAQLCDHIIMELEPTVIGIQNITSKQLQELVNDKCTYSFLSYEKAGVPGNSDATDDDEIFNPIFFKGDRLQPVDQADFNGYETDTFGSMAWAQFIVKSTSAPPRLRRNIVQSKGETSLLGKKLAFLFSNRAERNRHCRGHRGSVIIINANLKNTTDLAEKTHRLFSPIFKELMCRTRKKSLVMGNVGWLGSREAFEVFPKRSRKIIRSNRIYNGMYKTSGGNDLSNINQILSNDMLEVGGVAASVDELRKEHIGLDIGAGKTIKPVFVAFRKLDGTTH